MLMFAPAANFALPEEGAVFSKVEFIELGKEEALELVARYNKEGRGAQSPDAKRFRGNDRTFSRFGKIFTSLNCSCTVCILSLHL